MSGKTAKAKRKEEQEIINDYVARRDEFRKVITAASEKYKIDIVGGLKYGDTALVPMLVFVDVKQKYEHITDEAKKVNEKEKKENGVVSSKTPETPKLEV